MNKKIYRALYINTTGDYNTAVGLRLGLYNGFSIKHFLKPNSAIEGIMSMEKNRIRPIASGKSMRMSYARQKEVLSMEFI